MEVLELEYKTVINHIKPRTPRSLLDSIQAHAISRGFPNVYLGNIC